MPANINPLPLSLTATPTRPMAGVTVLLVEDSRSSSEAVRLLCVRSGARIRRADTMQAAWRHLSVYQPSVAIVDLGLPDGSGIDLIHELVNANTRIPAILGTTADDRLAAKVMETGADGFLLKPIENLAQFQNEVLRALPSEHKKAQLRVVSDDIVGPDDAAKRDDYERVYDLLRDDKAEQNVEYIAQFLTSIACSTYDAELADAAAALADAEGISAQNAVLSDVGRLLKERLDRVPAI